jgi:hypothetical protein
VALPLRNGGEALDEIRSRDWQGLIPVARQRSGDRCSQAALRGGHNRDHTAAHLLEELATTMRVRLSSSEALADRLAVLM